MDIDIVLGRYFTKKQVEQLKISNSTDLNGWYIYNYNKAFVNVVSTDFKRKKTFNSFLKLFTQIATHETIHHTISDITNSEVANDTEEKFVELMTGEKKWN